MYCNWGVDDPLALSVFCLPSINNNNNNQTVRETVRRETNEVGAVRIGYTYLNTAR